MTAAEYELPDVRSDRPPTTFHVADCLSDCPPAWFLGEAARDEWAVRHEDKTGHEVAVRTERIGVEHIRAAEPAPPVWEYRTVPSVEALNLAARDGWRLHTAVPFATHIQFVLERRRP